MTMLKAFAIAAFVAVALCSMVAAGDSVSVWPPPRSVQTRIGAGAHSVSSEFVIISPMNSLRLQQGITRYNTLIQNKRHSATNTLQDAKYALDLVEISIPFGAIEYLGMETKYDYNLTIEKGSAKISASTVYGAMYAMETLTQLIDSDTASIPFEAVSVRDEPQYAWRGLMLDSGRRFFPVPLVKNMLDTMSAVKLNVLHLHASDMCRFGVESKLYPNLTASLTGIHGGFYTQEDVADIISYAKDRGIRVVPEFDLPGHSRGYIPVESEGVEFCTDVDSRNQLYGDPSGSTLKVVTNLMKEMSSLFEDEVFNIGCDETSVKGPCTLNSTFKLERAVLNMIETELNKTAEGWEEVYFDAQAATNRTIVNAWARHLAYEITATGRRAVESAGSHFYFTDPAPAGAAGWTKCWYAINTNVPSDQLNLLLGGEISMWSDRFCYIDQCGASPGANPPGSPLFPPERDTEFGEAIGGMIWPRGFVGAAAFYNFNASVDPSSDDFVAQIYKINDEVQSRGGLTCPSKCACDELSACGKPYIKPAPPVEGSAIMAAPCNLSKLGQLWEVTSQGIVSASNTSLCIKVDAAKIYPLKLAPCDGDVFTHDPTSANLVHTKTGDCLDIESSGEIGTWDCGTPAQPNQQWSVDPDTKAIVSMSHYGSSDADSGHAGECLEAVPPY